MSIFHWFRHLRWNQPLELTKLNAERLTIVQNSSNEILPNWCPRLTLLYSPKLRKKLFLKERSGLITTFSTTMKQLPKCSLKFFFHKIHSTTSINMFSKEILSISIGKRYRKTSKNTTSRLQRNYGNWFP